MKSKVCLLLNYAPHYRSLIFNEIDLEFDSAFYFGVSVFFPLKKMDYSTLKGFKKELKSIKIFRNFYWQQSALKIAFQNYNHFILTGDPFCVSNWLVLIIIKLRGRKTHLWGHGWYGRETRIKKFVKRMFYGMADKLLLYGEYSKSLMVTEGFKEKKLVPIYNSLNYNVQKLIRTNCLITSIYEAKFNNNNPVVIYIGRIQHSKKLDFLVEAIYLLHEQQKKCNLVIVGEDKEGVDLEQLVQNRKLGKYTWFYGSCYDEKIIGELLFNASVCVSPGNVGLTAIHSLTYGTPVITHNDFTHQGPEFEAIQPGITGTFYEEGDIQELVDRIAEYAFKNSEEREYIRKACFAIVDDKYNPAYQINVLKKVLV